MRNDETVGNEFVGANSIRPWYHKRLSGNGA